MLVTLAGGCATAPAERLRLAWQDNMLTVSSPRVPGVPGGAVKIWYLEAYCRPGSTDRAWDQTVIGHRTRLVAADADGARLTLQCVLNDGVVVDHEIRAGTDEVDFQITARNPTAQPSAAHWAQPCIRVDTFTGRGQADYLDKCFIFLDGKLARLPTRDWATAARYTPGQVWCPAGVSREDVNPRPLSRAVPDNGLIGCFSGDERMILAVAFEPYQELFQGVIACIHCDFRIGGLEPSQSKRIRGKLYVVPADGEALRRRYERDFPEHGGRR
jgi:hypothetical protein